MSRPPPEPVYVLRGHEAEIHCVKFLWNNEYLATGDLSGRLCLWNLSTKRARASWKAHSESILAIESWQEDTLLSQARDNKTILWRLPQDFRVQSTEVGPEPEQIAVLDVGSMTFCRMALLSTEEGTGFIAAPNVAEPYMVDLFALPSGKRLLSRIGSSKPASKGIPSNDMCMAIKLFYAQSTTNIMMLAGYESGTVRLWALRSVLSLDLSSDSSFALSSSADNLIVKYALVSDNIVGNAEQVVLASFKTKRTGNSMVRIRDDGKIIGTVGWDGKARIFSAKTFKPLAVLDYHRDSLYTLDIAPVMTRSVGQTDASSQPTSSTALTIGSRSVERKAQHLLACAGKDERISLWDIY
ncbi:hypothetical protein BZG36_01652 [Bifiguratus adelaidae]|uniref:ASTRA-associated protein 1 n=1 Tax=Bifiguratus adelaidae TaxID=1938954 RepID=A0A261Y497_9FUNG|nr:hypothetical protein BZG36_01652 [Bifiguratus adelaidae]